MLISLFAQCKLKYSPHNIQINVYIVFIKHLHPASWLACSTACYYLIMLSCLIIICYI